jgi:hypothetical protein
MQTRYVGFGFLPALALLFIALKLLHVIAWAWFWVLFPIVLPIILIIIVLLIGLFINIK